MESQTGAKSSIGLGPFLTLLVLVTAGRVLDDRDHLATVDTAPWQTLSNTRAYSPELTAVRGKATYLGPFLTLILTLHCRNGISTVMGRSIWHVAPFVRIGTAP